MGSHDNYSGRGARSEGQEIFLSTCLIGLIFSAVFLFANEGPSPANFSSLKYFLWIGFGVVAFLVVAATRLPDEDNFVKLLSAGSLYAVMLVFMLYRMGSSNRLPLSITAPLFVLLACTVFITWYALHVNSRECARTANDWSTDQRYATHNASVAYDDGGHEEPEQRQSPNRIVFVAKPARVNFSKVSGMKEFKAEFIKVGKEIISRKSNRNGIVLSGDPGNGKTFLTEALAGELGIPIVTVTYGDVASKWVGETTQNVVKAFDDARVQAPCLLFIDEADSLFVDRGKVTQAESEASKTVNAILTKLVDLRGSGVVIVAATNHPDSLDSASQREGRFDFKVEVPSPDLDARLNLLKRGMKNGQYVHAAVQSAAERWEGFSVVRIRSIASEAVRLSNGRTVDFEVLMKALRKVQGRQGSRLPESVQTLDRLAMDAGLRTRLNRLAKRLAGFYQVEQMGGSLPNGVLFYGPPGNGKTRVAMALAKTVGWPFLKTTGQELQSDAKKIDELVAKARDLRPCIVFIDEGDDVLRNRGTAWSMDRQTTNKLIAAIDGADGRLRDVVWIAATNFPDALDEGAMRGGRFGEKIEFRCPEDGTLKQAVEKWLASSVVKLENGFTAGDIAQMLSGYSFADTEAVLKEAATIVVLDRGEGARMGIADVEDAMRAIE